MQEMNQEVNFAQMAGEAIETECGMLRVRFQSVARDAATNAHQLLQNAVPQQRKNQLPSGMKQG
jgi:hypothetical protein